MQVPIPFLQPYSIKRHGTTLNDCDSEPVQTPGCIQPHGALMVLRPEDLVVLQASENSAVWLGVPAGELTLRPVGEIWGKEFTELLRDFLAREIVERNPIYFVTLSPLRRPEHTLDVTVHTVNGVVILEFEATGRRVAGQKTSEPDYYSLVKKTLTRFQNAPTLKGFCQVVTEEIRRITDLDRVMVYKFHADDSGEVFAESRREDLQSWLGFRYPSHDIPKPAREIFKRIWIRPVPAIQAELAEMVPLANPDTGLPLEMTHCALRGASVMYTEYLENMGVGAALTMSIKRDGELWGLIACHHYSPTNFSYQLRAACEFVAQAASLQLKAAEDREHLAYRDKLDALHYELLTRAAKGDPSALVEGTPNLLAGIDAGGVAVLYRGAWHTTGKTPSVSDLDRLADWLRGTAGAGQGGSASVFATDHLAAAWEGGASMAEFASGVLAASISSHGRSFVIWFRPETIQTFTWAGNPNELPLVSGPHGPRLTPRKSFELWRETVRQRSLPWKPVEIESAGKLRGLLVELVVNQADRLHELNVELSRSNEDLNAFAYAASHDLKEPLRGIDKYAAQVKTAVEQGKVETASALERLGGIEKLVSRMSDLINSLLHYSRLGNSRLDFERIDLNAVLAESREMLGLLLEENKVEVRIPRPLPVIEGNRIRIREIFYNLISNGVKYNQSASKRIEIGWLEGEEAKAAGAPQGKNPAGNRVYYVKDNGIGIESRHFDQIFRIFKRLHARETFGGGSGAGLAIVKRLVEQHRGEIWLESQPGAGTTFFFTLEGVG